MEDNFRATVEMVVKKKDIKKIRIIVKLLVAMGVIDEKIYATILCSAALL